MINYYIEDKDSDYDYDELYKVIKSTSKNGYIHLLGSTWIISTDLSIDDVKDIVLKRMYGENDLLIVTEIIDYSSHLYTEDNDIIHSLFQ